MGEAGYQPGYDDDAVSMLEARTAAARAGFFLRRLRRGMRVLDAGCGPGAITVGLADAVAGGGVVGVDAAASQVERARAAAGRSAAVSFVVAPVERLPFPEASFDAVLAHALFEHLRDPASALRELRRVLRPGGLIGLASSDWGGALVIPPTPALLRGVTLHLDGRRRVGGDPLVGRRLGELLHEAGFEQIELGARYERDLPPAAMGRYLARRLPRDAEPAAREALERWGDCPYALFAQCWVEAVATRGS